MNNKPPVSVIEKSNSIDLSVEKFKSEERLALAKTLKI